MRELHLSHEQSRELVRISRSQMPKEACGLLLGVDNKVISVIAIPNTAPDPIHHFVLQPEAYLRALQQADTENLQLLAIFHSHPTSRPIVSQEDIHDSRRSFPTMTHLLISLVAHKPQLAAWHITADDVQSVELVLRGISRINNRDFELSQTQVTAIVIAGVLAVLLFVIIAVGLLPPPPPLPAG